MKEKIPAQVDGKIKQKNMGKVVGTFLVGILLLGLSAQYLVNAAIVIATNLNVSAGIIGLTLVSLGTTIPELIINFTAVRKGEVALAIGEILGSSVMNLTLVLGSVFALSANPVNFSEYVLPVAFIVMANSMLVYYFIKHEGVGRVQGLIFLSMYVVFIGLQVALQVV